MSNTNQLTKSPMILYSTIGCHLCETVATMLQQVQQVENFDWQMVDIMTLTDDQMHALADQIPVLYYQNRWLYYPFSLLEIVDLLKS